MEEASTTPAFGRAYVPSCWIRTNYTTLTCVLTKGLPTHRSLCFPDFSSSFLSASETSKLSLFPRERPSSVLASICLNSNREDGVRPDGEGGNAGRGLSSLLQLFLSSNRMICGSRRPRKSFRGTVSHERAIFSLVVCALTASERRPRPIQRPTRVVLIRELLP